MASEAESVRDISRIAYGFISSRALFAALDVGLFTALHDRAETVETLAGELHLVPEALHTLVAVLAAEGLVASDGELVRNSPAADRFLVKGSRQDYSDYLRLQVGSQLYKFLPKAVGGLRGELSEMVSDGAEAFFANKVEAELFSRAQHAGSLGPAHQLAKRLDLSRYGLMLDVAGGSGAFSITFCERSDDLRATVLDFENVVDVARLYVIEAGMSDRIDFIVGSALDVRWPEEVDLVLMSYLLSAVPGRHHQQLLNSAWSALAPGGDLVVHDFMLDPNQSGPLAASQWFFAYLPTVPGAVSFSDLRLVDLARSAGFVNVSSEDFIPGLTRIVVARKPGEESG